MVFGKGKKKKKEEVKRVSFEDEETTEEEQEEIEEEYPEEMEEEEMKPIRRFPSLPKTWQVRDVATQTEKVLFNSKTNKALDLHSAIAEILNRTE